MRRTLAKLPSHPVLARSAAAFSSGGGRGGPIKIQFTTNESHPGIPNDEDDAAASAPPQGHGRGRGAPAFSNSSSNRPPIGRGRGLIDLKPPPFIDQQKPSSNFENQEDIEGKPKLPGEVMNVLSSGGAGRGSITRTFVDDKPKIENRHIRQRPPQPEARPPTNADPAAASRSSGPELSQEEKTRKAVEILSKGSRDVGSSRGGRGKRREDGDSDADFSDYEGMEGLGEKDFKQMLENDLGPEHAETFMESFDEAFDNVVPDPEKDEFLDALHTNFLLECEPEYFMEEFGTNPDIDEKPIIPLREAFEKMKPFLMSYEGIKDEEEWKEVIDETMKNVPLMKKVVDSYAGPDRITAKEQNKELERVAKTLPESAPASVKRFTERALLSLQSNPGWGFDKKCLFMDKLVDEVSRQYK